MNTIFSHLNRHGGVTLADPLTKGECDERCIHMALPIANRKHIAILTFMMFLHSRQFRYMKYKLAF